LGAKRVAGANQDHHLKIKVFEEDEDPDVVGFSELSADTTNPGVQVQDRVQLLEVGKIHKSHALNLFLC